MQWTSDQHDKFESAEKVEIASVEPDSKLRRPVTVRSVPPIRPRTQRQIGSVVRRKGTRVGYWPAVFSKT